MLKQGNKIFEFYHSHIGWNNPFIKRWYASPLINGKQPIDNQGGEGFFEKKIISLRFSPKNNITLLKHHITLEILRKNYFATNLLQKMISSTGKNLPPPL